MSADAWDRLTRAGAHAALVDHLRDLSDREHGRLAFDAQRLADTLSLPSQVVVAGLDLAVSLRLLAHEDAVEHATCGTSLTDDDIAGGMCPREQTPIEPDSISRRRLYVRDAAPARDIPWLLCIHGFNTPGRWQEAFAWQVALVHYRSVPVYIHKYGVLRVGVLLRRRQRQLADRLAVLVGELAADPSGSRLGLRPDVICHSFGTWLIGHALLRHPDVGVGRVVLVAPVLRPDFPWAALLARGQVEAVLAHRGGKDVAVPLAAYGIPDSGPSGSRGFDPGVPVADHLEPRYAHSDFFMVDHLPHCLAEVWTPFLRDPSPALPVPAQPVARPWRRPPRLLMEATRGLVLLGVAAIACGVALIFARGVMSFFLVTLGA